MIGNLLKVDEVSKLLSLSKGSTYKLLRSGEIEAKRLGRNIVVEPEELRRYVSELPSYRATLRSA